MTLPVTFLTDYGYADEFAGVCRAVMKRIAPEAPIIDLTHGIPRGDVRAGAISLANSLPFTDPGVHLAVVDPGVGSGRRAVAAQTAREGRILVGPDNGLLTFAAEGFGGFAEAVEISRSPFALEPLSATFHGRDLFAPVSAYLTRMPLGDVGARIDPGSLADLPLPQARSQDGRIICHVIAVDGFGNVTLNAGRPMWSALLPRGEPVHVKLRGAQIRIAFERTFSDVPPGEAVLFEDSSRRLALAVNGGDAAQTFGLHADSEVVLSPRP